VVIGGGGGRLRPKFPRGWLEPRIIRPGADAPLAYKQASFLLPTMRLLNSMPVSPELSD